jgi:NAD dependent epimerase/dehydratase family enzyme
MKNKKILIAGGSGFIGQGVAKYFGMENEIIILTRNNMRHHSNLYQTTQLQASEGYKIKYCKWDGKSIGDWMKELAAADIVINLTGKSVNCRYHQKQKREIIKSRIDATNIIGDAIRTCVHPPKLWINAASATIYRNTFDRPNDEFNGIISELKSQNMPWTFLDQVRYYKNRLIASVIHGKQSKQYRELKLDFSVQVCKEWEKAFFDQRMPFTRKVALRTAITLGKGGVITPYLNLCKYGLGGKQGDGAQMYSWVHIEDVCRLIEWLYENNEVEGIYNCAAPNAVTNKIFMKKLRETTQHPFGLPAPAWLLELGAWLIGTETELMLKSRWVFPTRSLNEGFVYKYETLDNALEEIVSTLRQKHIACSGHHIWSRTW